MRGRLQCLMWVGWDGVGLVIRGQRYSKSTFGANKKGHTNPRGLVDINRKSHRIWTHELKKEVLEMREDINRENVFFRALLELWGEGGPPIPNFWALFQEVHFYRTQVQLLRCLVACH